MKCRYADKEGNCKFYSKNHKCDTKKFCQVKKDIEDGM